MTSLRTDLKSLIEESMPSFSNVRLAMFSVHDLRPVILTERNDPLGSVDLTRVVGVKHPDYHGCSWIELLGYPPGVASARLKRASYALYKLNHEPDYYLRPTKKEHWSFYLIDGNYYVYDGVHRTVIARFFLELNNLPPIIKGVSVTELTPRKPEPKSPPPPNGFWKRIRRLVFSPTID